MSNLTCSRSCLIRYGLGYPVGKFSFIKENWLSFTQTEDVDRLSKAELQCSLYSLDMMIDGLSKDEFSRPDKELVCLVTMCVYIQERLGLCKIRELHTKLMTTSVKKKKEQFFKSQLFGLPPQKCDENSVSCGNRWQIWWQIQKQPITAENLNE